MPETQSGKVILVTGASGGLGHTVVEACLAEGAAVGAVARSLPGGDPGREHFLPLPFNLTDPGACREAVASTIARFGRLDALLHLVGGFAGGKPVEETSTEDLEQMLTMNLRTSFYMFQAAVAAMRRRGTGRIVAIGSRVVTSPAAGTGAYAASKAALQALTGTLAAELKDTGITANLVVPSIIDTEANRRAMPRADFSTWVKPASLASLLLWLLSDAAADVNGAVIPIYGKA